APARAATAATGAGAPSPATAAAGTGSTCSTRATGASTAATGAASPARATAAAARARAATGASRAASAAGTLWGSVGSKDQANEMNLFGTFAMRARCAQRIVSELTIRGCASLWSWRLESADVERIDGNVGFIAGVNSGCQLGLAFGSERKAGRKEHEHFAAWNRAQILCQSANGKQHGARAVIGCRVGKAR